MIFFYLSRMNATYQSQFDPRLRFFFKLLIILLLIFLTSCKSTKKTTTISEQKETIVKVDSSTHKTIERIKTTDIASGSLSGDLPIIRPLTPKDTIRTTIESEGITLDLTITDKGVKYKARSKGTIKITESEKQEETKEVKADTKIVEDRNEETVEEKDSWIIGLAKVWWWLPIFLIIVYLVVRKLKIF